MRSREEFFNISRRVGENRLTISENCLEAGSGNWKTLSERELEVEIDAATHCAEAPAGSPLTLSETVRLKPEVPVTVAV